MYSETRSERPCNVTLRPQGSLRPRLLLSGLFVCFSAGGNCHSGRVKKHHRIQLNQLTLNPGDCEHGTGLKTQFSPQPCSQSTAVRSDHCLSAPPRRQQLQTKRFLNVPAGPAERTYVLTRAGPVRVVLVLPVSGAAEWDSRARTGSYGSSSGARGAGLPPAVGVRATYWPTAVIRHFPFKQRALSLVGVNVSGGT